MGAQGLCASPPEPVYQLVRERIAPHFSELARCRSGRDLALHPRYRELQPAIAQVLSTLERGEFTPHDAPSRPYYRFIAWNVERGIHLDGQIEALRTHPYLRQCDVILLTEADLGMARSGNRHVARVMARELGFRYVFAPCYLNLSKGSGAEFHADGDNEFGLHGNAVLSRYPIGAARAIPLPNGIDKMACREKRIGCQVALAAEIDLPGRPVTAVSIHLDAQSTQRHRRDQMACILDALDRRRPVVLGGDWNTSTYNSSRAFHAIMGFWRRVLMGVDHVIRNHYLAPYNYFERRLFALVEEHGFDYRSANLLRERTSSYHVDDHAARQNLGEWVPWWCFAFIRWALRNHGGYCPLKLDWFATRDLRCRNPMVVHDLGLSDHDPITIDILP